MINKPAWFNLENYRDLQSFDLSNWYTQLNFRHGLKFYMSIDKAELSISSKKDFNFRVQAIQSGIVDINNNVNLDYIVNHQKKSVSDLAVFDFVSSADWVHREAKEELFSKKSFDNLQEKIDPMFYNSTANIKIDLNASNEQIKKDFDKWLKNKKRPPSVYKNKNKTNINEINFYDWIDHRLLPLIDLSLYFEANKMAFKPVNFSEWLFPENSKYRDRGNFRTIEKEAKWLISSSAIEQITSQLYL